MHKNSVKTRLIIAFPKSSINPLVGTITSIFRLFFRKIQTYNNKCRFLTGVNTFWLVQNKLLMVLNSFIDFCFDGG